MSKGGTVQNDKDTLGGVAGAIKTDGNKEFIYCYVAAAVAAGTPLILTFDGDEEYNPKTTGAPSALAVYQLVVFCPKLIVTAGFYWCQYRGDANILANGTSAISKDDFLKLAASGTALVKDATTVSTYSVAIAQEANATTTNALTNVYLLGHRVIIA